MRLGGRVSAVAGGIDGHFPHRARGDDGGVHLCGPHLRRLENFPQHVRSVRQARHVELHRIRIRELHGHTRPLLCLGVALKDVRVGIVVTELRQVLPDEVAGRRVAVPVAAKDNLQWAEGRAITDERGCRDNALRQHSGTCSDCNSGSRNGTAFSFSRMGTQPRVGSICARFAFLPARFAISRVHVRNRLDGGGPAARRNIGGRARARFSFEFSFGGCRSAVGAEEGAEGFARSSP